MEDQKQHIIDKLRAANNILVTVNANPSVDQLSACIGLTLLLNKMNKHATAVFSGQVPPIMQFLKPEETIETNTDSLRDFIISLDKAKADKLRYKVEDEIVKIFITPYKASISEKDLVFSQGDFNVDVVIALGVHRQQDLDTAITAHGRILHDAVVISINNTPDTELGTINWQDTKASGMSELVTSLATNLGLELLDPRIATALLAGIVAETDHFGNVKTTAQTMTVSAALLAAGANQQLVAAELGHSAVAVAAIPEQIPPEADDGPLKISHDDLSKGDAAPDSTSTSNKPDVKDTKVADPLSPAVVDTKPAPQQPVQSAVPAVPAATAPASKSIDDLLQQAEDDLVASSVVPLPEPAKSAREYPPKVEPDSPPNLNSAPNDKIQEDTSLQPDQTSIPLPVPALAPAPVTTPEKTLVDLEEAVHSPHVQAEPDVADEVDSARKAVEDALKASSAESSDPLQALNATPVNLDLGHDAVPVADGLPGYIETPTTMPRVQPVSPTANMPHVINPLPHNPAANEPAPLNMSPADQPFTMPLPPSGGLTVPPPQIVPPTSVNLPPQGPPPPPVPPPMPPGFGPSLQ